MSYLKWAREKVGISQRELARRSGVMQADISRIEYGKKTPSIRFVAKVIPHLGNHVTELNLLYPDRYPLAKGRKSQRRKAA